MSEDDNPIAPVDSGDVVEEIKKELEASAPSKKKRIFEKFALAALGSIPWVGGFISAAVSLKTEAGDIKADNLQTKWLQEHEQKMTKLGSTMSDIGSRFEALGVCAVGTVICDNSSSAILRKQDADHVPPVCAGPGFVVTAAASGVVA